MKKENIRVGVATAYRDEPPQYDRISTIENAIKGIIARSPYIELTIAWEDEDQDKKDMEKMA